MIVTLDLRVHCRYAIRVFLLFRCPRYHLAPIIHACDVGVWVALNRRLGYILAMSPVSILEEHAGALIAMGVRRIGLFGSVLRPDEFGVRSDVDVYVEFDPSRKTVDNYFGLFEFLEGIFQRPIDLVTDRSLSPYIGPKILASVQYASLGN